jgi:hypothetical protein
MCVMLTVPAWAQSETQEPAPAPPSSDPFFRPPKVTAKAPVDADSNKPKPILFPPLEQRRQEYQGEPKMKGLNPIWQFLVSELVVTGVYETDKGLGAFVLATPTGVTYYVQARTKVYNGEIKAINMPSGRDATPNVVFEETLKFELKKKIITQTNTLSKNIQAPPKSVAGKKKKA